MTMFEIVASLLASVLAMAGAAGHPGRDHDEDDWPIAETRSFEESFELAAGQTPRVVVDDVWGSITVEAGPAGRVTVSVRETMRARTRAALEQARREVRLDRVHQGAEVRLYVDGPFRCEKSRGNCCCVNWGDEDYRPVYDFTLRVPERADLVLRTVNEGDVRVAGVHGEFEVRNVNGPVRLERVAGSGTAKTVNGEVLVAFTRNPTGDCEFSTVNGDVNVALRPGLAADAKVKTMNGEMWSDFPFTTLPSAEVVRSERGGKTVFRSQSAKLRIAQGGPLLTLETLNGDILIRSVER
jgi:hypothetical protein